MIQRSLKWGILGGRERNVQPKEMGVLQATYRTPDEPKEQLIAYAMYKANKDDPA